MLEDKHKQQAIFVTQGLRYTYSNNFSGNQLIDYLIFLKLAVEADGKLNYKQITIELP